MFTLPCTKKLLSRLGVTPVVDEVEPTTRLVDWYANLLFRPGGQVILFVNEQSLLPVLVPARPSTSLVTHFAEAAVSVLRCLGVPAAAIEAVCREMDEVRVWKTANSMSQANRSSSGLWRSMFAVAVVALWPATTPAAAPVLFFSDITSGPKTGWDGSSTKGAAVTIWGIGFGAPRGTSYVTVNGARLTNDADYAEWATTDTANVPRGLQRTTFWLNSSCADGTGTISATVAGVTSNALAFTVRSGNIYFISVNDGSNSYNGHYSTRAGHTGSDGPWKDLYRVSPSNNGILAPGDTIYVRGGTYTQLDDQQMFVHLRPGSSGTAPMPYAALGYPGETPVCDGTGATRGFNYQEGATADYWTFSKFRFLNGYTAFSAIGNYTRIIGNSFQNMLSNAWSGVIWVSDAQHTCVYGNYWDHVGYDKYKHNIYAKTQPFLCSGSGPGQDVGVQFLDIGWNEFSNPVSSDNYGGTVFLSKSSDACVASLSTSDISIHDNYFHGGVADFIYTGDGVFSIDNVNIYNNIFSGGSVASHGCIYMEAGTKNVNVFNNTFYQTANGADALVAISSNGSSQAVGTVMNNIFYAVSNQTYLLANSAGGILSSDHDLFYNGSGIPGFATNSMTGDPLFVAADTDFHLQASSPAVKAGTSAVSAIVTSDYDGVSRPQGSYDIGAYEFVVSCAVPADCTTPSVCRAAAGATCSGGSCIYPPSPAGTACDDGNACTSPDVCDGLGVCASGADVCGGGKGGDQAVGACGCSSGSAPSAILVILGLAAAVRRRMSHSTGSAR